MTCFRLHAISLMTADPSPRHLHYQPVALAHILSATASPAGWSWMLLTFLLCMLSVLSKEVGITVVAICLTYDVFLARKVRVGALLMVCGNCRGIC